MILYKSKIVLLKYILNFLLILNSKILKQFLQIEFSYYNMKILLYLHYL